MLLYNVAEAYFRDAKYNEALSHYDRFISENSHDSKTSWGRVRIGLIYEITGKDKDMFLPFLKGPRAIAEIIRRHAPKNEKGPTEAGP